VGGRLVEEGAALEGELLGVGGGAGGRLCCRGAEDRGGFGGWFGSGLGSRLRGRLWWWPGRSSGFLEEAGGGKTGAEELACLCRGALARGLLPDEQEESRAEAPGEGRHLELESSVLSLGSLVVVG
jgi:hypothetical protein